MNITCSYAAVCFLVSLAFFLKQTHKGPIQQNVLDHRQQRKNNQLFLSSFYIL